MKERVDVSFERREEMMVSLTGGGNPTKRLAHFLKHNMNSIEGPDFELPSHCLSSVPDTFDPRNWPLKVKFPGWRSPHGKWEAWVDKMAALHESTWKKVGIYEAILSSTYAIRRNYDLVCGLGEKWCPETKTFIFPWGEATITLEDMLISGYSVLGSPVFSPLESEELKEIGGKLNQVRRELNKSSGRKADYTAWMGRFMDSGSDIEHEAFLALWLSRFVFSHSVITKPLLPIAVHLARGTTIALAPAILASIYRDLSLFKQMIVALTKLVNCEDGGSELEITLRSLFQLVQVWAWERFMELRPKRNEIKRGEPRIAQWHKVNTVVENVRTVLDSSKESFDWRPYAKTLTNWKPPEFYTEKELWVLIDGDLSEELQSLARCLRVSELVGIDCMEQYLPHRVAMQFGMDQDLPAFVGRANETLLIAWSHYSKPISCGNFYIPARLYEADVTTRYLEWWNQSFSRHQIATGFGLPKQQFFSNSGIEPKRSKPEIKPTDFGMRTARAKKVKKFDHVSWPMITVMSWKTTGKRNFTGRVKITPRRLERLKGQVNCFVHPSFTPTDLDNSPETSHEKKRGYDDSLLVGSPLKRKRNSMESLNEKEVSDESASTSLPTKELPLSLIIKREADNSLVPPGFPPKSNVVQAKDSVKGDGLLITDSQKSSNKQNDIQKTKASAGENSSCHSQIPSHLNADNEFGYPSLPSKGLPLSLIIKREADNSLVPPGFPPKLNVVQAKDLAKEDDLAITDSLKSSNKQNDIWNTKGSCHGQDMTRKQGSKGDGKKYAREVMEKLEAWVSRIEGIVAEMKAARFGHERPISSSK